jgi:hypothetical protein
MPIFTVATKYEENDELLRNRITELFPTDNYDVGRGQWLISFTGTAKDLYLKLAPPASDDNPYTIKGTTVFGIGGYFGVTSRDMWEWIATKLGGKPA